MKRAKDSPKVKVNLSSRKNVSVNVSSSVLKKSVFDTNQYYYFTEVRKEGK